MHFALMFCLCFCLFSCAINDQKQQQKYATKPNWMTGTGMSSAAEFAILYACLSDS